MINKILTVTVPAYNVEKYLKRCLLSLTYDTEALPLLEIIVVSDGSTDSTLDIAQEFASKYPNSISVVDKENGGHGSTINTGLKLAAGKYFRVIDADDWVNIDDFGNFVRRLEELDTDIVITNYCHEMAYIGTKLFHKYKKLEYDKPYSLNTMSLKLLGDDYFYMATSTIKTNRLREANLTLDEHTFYVDMEYNILPIKYITTFIYLKFDIYRYWIGRPEQSMDLKNTFKNRSHHEKVLRRLIDFYDTTNKGLTKNKREYVKKIIILMLNTHYFIYCNKKVPFSAAREIKKFDQWLKSASPTLYNAVAVRFPYISHYRKSNFFFASYLNIPFKKISNRLILQHEAESQGDD